MTLILENFKFYCINISGYKKLNGSQVLKENIAFILNSLKLSISETIKIKQLYTSLILKVYLTAQNEKYSNRLIWKFLQS